MKYKISIIIPAFNEEKAIKEVVLSLHKLYPDYEILVIDDGSTDETYKIVMDLPCRLIRHKKNKGYGATWKTGVMNAKGEVIVFFDGDNQFNPKDVQRLIDVFYQGDADLVSGVRTKDSYVSSIRRPLKLLLKFFVRILIGRSIVDLNCGLRCVRRSLLKRYLSLLPDGFSASTTSLMVFLYLNHIVSFVSIKTRKRIGKSSVRIVRDGFGAAFLVVRLVALFNPLKIFMPLSGTLLFFATIYSAYEVIMYKLGVPIFGSLMFVTGIFTFFFGIICDQISALRLNTIVIEEYKDKA